MIHFKLIIYSVIDDSDVTDVLKNHKTDDDVDVEVVSLDYRAAIKLKTGVPALILSDRFEILEPYLGLEDKYIYTALRVDSSAAAEKISAMEKLPTDIWPMPGHKALLNYRYGELLKKLKNNYLKAIYEGALVTTIDSIPELVWYKMMDGSHALVNQSFADTVRKTKEDIKGKSHYYIWDIPEEEYKKGDYVCVESEEEVINAGKTCIFDEPVLTKDGMREFNTYKTPLRDPFNNIYGTVGVAHDITDFSNMGLELSLLVENLPFAIVLLDANRKTVRLNSEFNRIFEFDFLNVDRFTYDKWINDTMTLIGDKRVNIGTGISNGEYKYGEGDDGRIYNITEQEIRDYFDNLTGWFCIINDVTIQRTFEKKMVDAANTDPLTGLFNRRYFYSHIKEYMAGGLTLFYMDLDHFKEINDNFGHARGDEILKSTAAKIKEVFPDGIPVRLGGDEFALLLKGKVSEERIKKGIEAMEKKIAGIFRTSDDFGFSISIGVTSTDDGEMDPDAFIHRADAHMYEIKKEHHAKHDRDEIDAALKETVKNHK